MVAMAKREGGGARVVRCHQLCFVETMRDKKEMQRL